MNTTVIDLFLLPPTSYLSSRPPTFIPNLSTSRATPFLSIIPPPHTSYTILVVQPINQPHMLAPFLFVFPRTIDVSGRRMRLNPESIRTRTQSTGPLFSSSNGPRLVFINESQGQQTRSAVDVSFLSGYRTSRDDDVAVRTRTPRLGIGSLVSGAVLCSQAVAPVDPRSHVRAVVSTTMVASVCPRWTMDLDGRSSGGRGAGRSVYD
ncbi:hypothetical protein GY45DRAFT_733673 [Cubamyces sp. BRFM 1775]|nr:hypothetical protein GY45DRAFT_733673 [Cubamyces sp. BRFM 1775]